MRIPLGILHNTEEEKTSIKSLPKQHVYNEIYNTQIQPISINEDENNVIGENYPIQFYKKKERISKDQKIVPNLLDSISP